jgi:integrase/recombinase XerD
MTTAPSLIAPYVQACFVAHLQQHKCLSPQTIASCRDTFRLLLHFMKHSRGLEPSALRVADLDAPTLRAFLDSLEQQRGNRGRSRNMRLSALRTFFRFVALQAPDSVAIATRGLAIPRKREDHKLIGYLTRAEIEALLAAPDRSHWLGRRDHALLLTMYHSGARVSEMVTLTQPQVHFGATTLLQ